MPSSSADASCAIIVLGWHSASLLEQCLRGLVRHETRRIYVVDNGSADDTISMVQREFPDVRVIASPGNLGFAEGNNVGVRQALAEGASSVFLLNNDTIIDEPFIEACERVLKEDSSVGIVGPIVVEADRPEVIQSSGGTWNLWVVDMPFRRRGERFIRREEWEEVDWVLGAAMMVRAEVFERAGGLLDAEFFPAYLEEADLCYRARKAGIRCAVTYSARVRHIGGRSSGGYNNAFRRMMVNRFRFALKHLPVHRFVVATAAICARVVLERMGLGWKPRTR